MEREEIHIFEIDRSFATLSKWVPWIAIVIILFFVALPFLPDEDRTSISFGAIGLSSFGAIFFGAVGWYGFRIAQQLPQSSISIDGDGLWLAHQSKRESLIRWEDVHSTRDRLFLQRLELLDKQENVMIKLEYQLAGFGVLRALLLEKISPPIPLPSSGRFAKGPIYHGFHIGCIAGFSALGWYVGSFNPLLGYGGMAFIVVAIVYDYLTTVSSVEVLRDRLKIAFPLQTQEIFREQIEEVQIDDNLNQGVRHPQVGLFVHGKQKPVRLRGLGVDATKLHQILEQWRHSAR